MSVEVTDNAKMELLKTLERLSLEEGQYLRLTTFMDWAWGLWNSFGYRTGF